MDFAATKRALQLYYFTIPDFIYLTHDAAAALCRNFM